MSSLVFGAKPAAKTPEENNVRHFPAWSMGALVLFAVASAQVARADILVASPGPQGFSEGDINNGFPFNIGDSGLPSMRYQQVYTSADFSRFPAINGPTPITAIFFRPDAQFGSAFSSTLPDVEISLSTTSATPSTLSRVFANNVGADNTVVFNGALSLSRAFTGPPSGPKAFDIVINLSTPFLYNPSAGDLLLDVTNFSSSLTTQFDAVSEGNSHVNRVWAFSAGATAGTLDSASAGLVTEFEFATPVPEPSALLLLASCIALTAGAIRHVRRSPASKAS